jgi:hypothetical protein
MPSSFSLPAGQSEAVILSLISSLTSVEARKSAYVSQTLVSLSKAAFHEVMPGRRLRIGRSAATSTISNARFWLSAAETTSRPPGLRSSIARRRIRNWRLCRPLPSTGDHRRQMTVFLRIVPSPEHLEGRSQEHSSALALLIGGRIGAAGTGDARDVAEDPVKHERLHAILCLAVGAERDLGKLGRMDKLRVSPARVRAARPIQRPVDSRARRRGW